MHTCTCTCCHTVNHTFKGVCFPLYFVHIVLRCTVSRKQFQTVNEHTIYRVGVQTAGMNLQHNLHSHTVINSCMKPYRAQNNSPSYVIFHAPTTTSLDWNKLILHVGEKYWKTCSAPCTEDVTSRSEHKQGEAKDWETVCQGWRERRRRRQLKDK